MNRTTRCIFGLLFLAFFSAQRSAHAQALHSPAAAADAFRKGREAVRRGDYTAAYALFQNSFNLDPTPGTMLNIADCEEHLGLIAQAANDFKVAISSMAPHDDRLPVITRRLAALEPRVPHILFPSIAGALNQVIMLDGAVLTSGSDKTPFDKPVRVNPGQHSARWVVSFKTGMVDVTASFTVAESEIRSIEVPPEVRSAATEAAQTPAPAPPTPSAALEEQPKAIDPRQGVTIHFIGVERDGWFVKALSTGRTLCDIPCDQVVRPDATLQLSRANKLTDSVMVSISGNKPGSVLDVTPHGGASPGPGIALMLGGVAVGVGSGVADGVACSGEACGSGTKTVLLIGAGVGVAAFVAGAVAMVWEATHVNPGADVDRRASLPSPGSIAF